MLSRYLLLLCLLTVVASAPICVPAQQAKPDAASARNQLIGAWRLVSIETIRPNGEIIYPFYGKHPEGLIVYDASGWMSVQITSDPRPTVPGADSREAFLAAATTEKVAAVGPSAGAEKSNPANDTRPSTKPASTGRAPCRS